MPLIIVVVLVPFLMDFVVAVMHVSAVLVVLCLDVVLLFTAVAVLDVLVVVLFALHSTGILHILNLSAHRRTHDVRLTHNRCKTHSSTIVLCIVSILTMNGIRPSYMAVQAVTIHSGSDGLLNALFIVSHHLAALVSVRAVFRYQNLGIPFPFSANVPVTIRVDVDTHPIIHFEIPVGRVGTLM